MSGLRAKVSSEISVVAAENLNILRVGLREEQSVLEGSGRQERCFSQTKKKRYLLAGEDAIGHWVPKQWEGRTIPGRNWHLVCVHGQRLEKPGFPISPHGPALRCPTGVEAGERTQN